MRILSLELTEFKNLKEFRAEFNSSSAVTVLVGRNGSGKSNLLEALTLIFRDLDLGQPSSFAYKITYECRGHIVRVDNPKPFDTRGFRVWVDENPIPFRRFTSGEGARYRPDHVFGYYSGPSNRLEEHYAAHQERFYRALLRGEDQPLRRLFYARNVHSNFVLLAFFLENDAQVRQLLQEHLGIEGLDSVLFVLHKPGWPQRNGDPRFWYARGTVSSFLSELYEIALAPLRIKSRTSTGYGKSSPTELLYLYLASLEDVRRLLNKYGRPQNLFKALESTYISELVEEVRIRVQLRRSPTSLTFRELSEGEQQLLLVLGLMRFTREEESLFLLDEPDTHLNPAWSVQYRRFLDNFGGLDERSHVLMATHDPLVIAGLLKTDVRILNWNNGKIRADEPLEDPRGMGVGALLTSDVYGLRSQLDMETLEKLDRKRQLAAAPSLNEQQAEQLDFLARDLHDLGLLSEDRDPDFQEYLAARRAVESEALQPVFTRDEVLERRDTAEEIVRRLLERGLQ